MINNNKLYDNIMLNKVCWITYVCLYSTNSPGCVETCVNSDPSSHKEPCPMSRPQSMGTIARQHFHFQQTLLLLQWTRSMTQSFITFKTEVYAIVKLKLIVNSPSDCFSSCGQIISAAQNYLQICITYVT